MHDLLAEMAVTSRRRAEALRARIGEDAVRRRALARSRAPALRLGRFDLIAECKLRAPSAGRLSTPADPVREVVRRARAYERAGAAAISVLTEPLRFEGSIDHLAAAAGEVAVPVMRKDFLVDPIQVWEARAAGAGGVLLIARLVDDPALMALLEAAWSAGLFVLLEAFDEVDLERIAGVAHGWPPDAAPLLVGVNARDLVTLQVDPDRFHQLSCHLPKGVPAVAESGVETADDIAYAVAAGYRLVLVGTALMRAPDPAALAAELLTAGREASPSCS